MTYQKPVLVLLASAEVAILGTKFDGDGDNDLLITPAAYEVDE